MLSHTVSSHTAADVKMPSLKTVGKQAAASASRLHGNFEAVWTIVDPSNITHDGQGQYSYTGAGGTGENIGTVRTMRPLDPQHKIGMSTFEVTIVEPGKRKHYGYNYVSALYMCVRDVLTCTCTCTICSMQVHVHAKECHACNIQYCIMYCYTMYMYLYMHTQCHVAGMYIVLQCTLIVLTCSLIPGPL